MIKAVIFDLDNTLLDFVTMKRESVRSALVAMSEAGLEIDIESSYKRIMHLYEEGGWENQLVFNDFLREKIGYVDYKYLAAGVMAYRKAKADNLKAYPNVHDTLEELTKKGIKLAIVSDAPSREAWMRIYALGIHDVFDVVVTFDDSKERKPSPAPFKLVLGKLNMSKDNVLMVGDWPERDVIGAKKLNMKTAFAKYGDMFGTDFSGADYDLDDISEILEIIRIVNNV